jgi:hypothetical protein
LYREADFKASFDGAEQALKVNALREAACPAANELQFDRG